LILPGVLVPRSQEACCALYAQARCPVRSAARAAVVPKSSSGRRDVRARFREGEKDKDRNIHHLRTGEN